MGTQKALSEKRLLVGYAAASCARHFWGGASRLPAGGAPLRVGYVSMEGAEAEAREGAAVARDLQALG